MTITDINSCAEAVCATERERRRSRNSKNASRNKYVAVRNACYIPLWLFPGN